MFKRKFSKIVAVCAVIFFLLFLFGFLNANFRRDVEESVLAVFGRKTAAPTNPAGSAINCGLTCAVTQENVDSLVRENETLRRALGLETASALKPITLAKVIGMSPDTGRGLLFINEGAGSGIKTGDIAYVLDKVLMGRISEVYGDFAVIETPFARGIKISARLTGASITTAGIFMNEKGLGDGALDLISKNINVGEGDRVLTNGEDGRYPAGFLIGNVANVELPSSGYFWNIGVEIPWEPGTLEEVFILHNPI